ncbi:MAG TPA: glycosyltransferase [Gemmatimonadales bacterium]|nr:glycosyltransferase [Gemmatimonadales bacterium]
MMTRAATPNWTTAVVPGLVSVITPCYNAAPFVGETLAAVRAQTYVPVEHIVVDDGSSDGSWAVVQAAAAEAGAAVAGGPHARATEHMGAAARAGAGRAAPLRAVRLAQNGGASHARNVGAALARGEYLMFLDADDLLAPDTLAALVAAVRDRPGSMGVCSWQRLRRSRTGAWVPSPREVPLPVPGADHLREVLAGTCWVPVHAVLWRRDVYARTGGWDETLTLDDDTDLTARALLDGVTLVLANGGEAYYRHHGADRLSTSADVFSPRTLMSQVRFADKLAARLEARGKFAEYATPLGAAYLRIAVRAYQEGFVDLGRECQARGEQLAGGPLPVSRSRVGRLLSRVLGMERKERVMHTLAMWGLGSRERRERGRLRNAHRASRDRRPEA